MSGFVLYYLLGVVALVGAIYIGFYFTNAKKIEQAKIEKSNCPSCNSENTVAGILFGHANLREARFSLSPRPIFLGSSVGVERSGYACADCGTLWARIDKTKLAALLKS